MVDSVAILVNDMRVDERTARLYPPHLRRFASWLAECCPEPLRKATMRDLCQYKAELAERLSRHRIE